MIARIFHLCLDIANCLRQKGYRQLAGACRDEVDGHLLSADEIKAEFEKALAEGKKVLPMCKPSDCPDFDYQTGCPGHEKNGGGRCGNMGPDGCCVHSKNTTPECTPWACPLAPAGAADAIPEVSGHRTTLYILGANRAFETIDSEDPKFVEAMRRVEQDEPKTLAWIESSHGAGVASFPFFKATT